MMIASFLALGIASTVLGLLCLGWFAFMLICRERHANITEVENAFWVRRGVIRPATAAKIARFESGRGMKVIYAVEGLLLILLGVGALFFHSRPQLLRSLLHGAPPHHQPALTPNATPKNSNP